MYVDVDVYNVYVSDVCMLMLMYTYVHTVVFSFMLFDHKEPSVFGQTLFWMFL